MKTPVNLHGGGLQFIRFGKRMPAALIQNYRELWHSRTSVGAFSTAPNLQGLFWTPHWSPRAPYPCVSLHLQMTNCTRSHNTLSAFNYCLEVSGLRVTHSTGSLRAHSCVVRVRACLVGRSLQLRLCATATVSREVLNSSTLFPPLLITYLKKKTFNLPQHQPLGPVLGV